MNRDSATIEKRIENMKNFYLKAGELIDNIPDVIPDNVKAKIKNTILNDKELTELMQTIESHRPPRIFLIGRTGFGKSSLINALCGSYVAGVSDVKSCTDGAYSYPILDGERVLMEIMDTRGLAESWKLDENVSAEDMLVAQLTEFTPDVAVLVLNCKHRDDVDADAAFLKKVAEKYEKYNDTALPIVVVVNKCDEMPPPRIVDPEEYPEKKLEKIEEVTRDFRSIIMKEGLKINGMVPVSSLIEWQTPDGEYVYVDDIAKLPETDRENLEIYFDGRYNIDKLFNFLEDAIRDTEAQRGLRMAFRLEELVRRLARHLNATFAGISATIALTPIPIADLYILIIVQSVLVALIAALSGRELSLQMAKDFIFSLSGVVGAGLLFRTIAHQAVKLLNGVFPGAGSAISAGIASSGTYAIGNAAIAHYIDGKSMKDVKTRFDKENRERQKKIREEEKKRKEEK